MELTISDAERELLLKIANQYYMALRAEIYKTETSQTKRELKEEESMLKSLLDRLKS
ncbi:MAG TPA: hypothetical protein VEZ90_08475 [Blastocatellia bacterium]|nr:hypothetical protein [Blastocatellia bacterium]